MDVCSLCGNARRTDGYAISVQKNFVSTNLVVIRQEIDAEQHAPIRDRSYIPDLVSEVPMDFFITWQWLGQNANALAAVAALTSIVMFSIRLLLQLYSAISLNATVGRMAAFFLRVVGYVGDRAIWVFVGIVLAVSTDAFNFLAKTAT